MLGLLFGSVDLPWADGAGSGSKLRQRLPQRHETVRRKCMCRPHLFWWELLFSHGWNPNLHQMSDMSWTTQVVQLKLRRLLCSATRLLYTIIHFCQDVFTCSTSSWAKVMWIQVLLCFSLHIWVCLTDKKWILDYHDFPVFPWLKRP